MGVRFDFNQIRNPPIGADLKGMLVSFKVQTTPDGKLRAERVQLQSGKKAKQLREAATVVTFGGYDQPMSQMKTGTVKSFNLEKGFGFINAPGCPDIYFGKSDVQGGAPNVGTTVQFNMIKGKTEKLFAKEVRIGSGGMKRSANGMPNFAPPSKQMKGQGKGGKTQGVIKSFNAAKGFGFISSPKGDIFFMKTDLPMGEAEAGTPVSCRVQQGPDGRLRAQNIVM